jgi:hypothetical protein
MIIENRELDATQTINNYSHDSSVNQPQFKQINVPFGKSTQIINHYERKLGNLLIRAIDFRTNKIDFSKLEINEKLKDDDIIWLFRNLQTNESREEIPSINLNHSKILLTNTALIEIINFLKDNFALIDLILPSSTMQLDHYYLTKITCYLERNKIIQQKVEFMIIILISFLQG